eukprot:TRINITY_DN9695_c0_g1_i1.p1 TRINITY_DN9695_c0_g1~~TRINITY_DN9695_c0_g1_i1.p1  ORF type:complete len:231 (-),score=26.26 TRINITY_DN9695_c0_g1_i1:229-876(-)
MQKAAVAPVTIRQRAQKQSNKVAEKKYFSAPSYCSVPPPPPPQRRPTIPSVEPPPLYLTPASPDSAPYFGMPIKSEKTRNRSCSLSDYIASSCPAPAYVEQGLSSSRTSDYLIPARKDSLGVGSVPRRQLPSITEKGTEWMGSSPTIISLLATDKLSVPKAEETITKEENKASVGATDFDLFDLESTLSSVPIADDLQFEMEELVEGESSAFHAV